MRKLYLSVLVAFTLIINSYIVDYSSYAGFTDSTEKLTHFYPNPATSYINFAFDKSVDRNYSLQVYNFIGRKMNDIRITESKITINLDNNYFRGLYIYQLRDQSGRIIESGKFQVQK
ncbi:MAG: T9SS type A sorting domain-containing protein [Chitinophagaceae bacterium]|nr:T9SS type A sorting domain-containing protein [Chitinophagaceae bacterium]